jgi:mannose-6-phosphate isomerase-like protein (cupin superfamily)
MIEKYIHEGIGYNPIFIRDGWQVAKLNPLPGHGLNEIDKLEVHHTTDEIFILIHGIAVLIAADIEDEIQFETLRMQPGVIYNIPKKQWHNIAMENGAELIIVEKDNTHLRDCTYKSLNQKQQNELKQLIQKAVIS